jgi:hypothetical protein
MRSSVHSHTMTQTDLPKSSSTSRLNTLKPSKYRYPLEAQNINRIFYLKTAALASLAACPIVSVRALFAKVAQPSLILPDQSCDVGLGQN